MTESAQSQVPDDSSDARLREHWATETTCCECGSTTHTCQDCPTFGGPDGT